MLMGVPICESLFTETILHHGAVFLPYKSWRMVDYG